MCAANMNLSIFTYVCPEMYIHVQYSYKLRLELLCICITRCNMMSP